MRTTDYRQITSQRADRVATFRRQMADFARGERLRDLREARHLSQEEAAHEIGVSVKSLRAWEKGGGIRWTNAKGVAAFYRVDPESLVSREAGGEERTPTPDPFASESAAAVEELRGDFLALRTKLLSELAVVRSAQEELLRRIPPPAQGTEDSDT